MAFSEHAAASARAARISTAVADRMCRPGFSARVHSVFRGALNLLSGDDLLTLVLPDVGIPPNGLELEEACDFLALGIAPGSPVRGDGAQLQLPGQRFLVDLDAAAPWSPFLQPLGQLRPLEDLASVLISLLLRVRGRNGFGPLLLRLALHGDLSHAESLPFTCAVAERALNEVLVGLRADDLDQAMHGAAQLVGLGHGLTPSGDDALVGLSAALRVTGHPLAQPFAAACAAAAKARTTSVAETFLLYAARGAYSARLHTLLDALRPTVPDDQLARALTLTLDWGETSGADCLLGVLLGGTFAGTPALIGVP